MYLYKNEIRLFEEDNNNSMNNYAHKFCLKYIIIYFLNISNNDLKLKYGLYFHMNMNLILGIKHFNQGDNKYINI